MPRTAGDAPESVVIAGTFRRTVARRIFASSMDMGEKLHLAELFKQVADIADAAEDAADELEFAAMKSVF